MLFRMRGVVTLVLVAGAAACGEGAPSNPNSTMNTGGASAPPTSQGGAVDPVGGKGAGGSGGRRNSGGSATSGRDPGAAGDIGLGGSSGEQSQEGGAAGVDGTNSGTGGGGSGQGGAKPSAAKAPGDVVFAEGRVLEFRLRMSASDWEYLEAHGNEEEYLPASAVITGKDFPQNSIAQVGVRHKGAYSLHHCWDNFDGVRGDTPECKKLSYKLKFDEYLPDARLDGLKRINLHASAGDATKVRELLAYDTFRAFGVDAPRARPAKLFINDIFQGLFIAVEDVDGRYTKAHYPEAPDGNLYKEVWPQPGVSERSYLDALETNEEAGDVSDILAFAQAIGATNSKNFEADMRAWVNLDELLRYVAVDRALKNWDGIMAFYSPQRPHNFFWYHEDSPDGLFHLLPWDLDNTFWEFDPYMHPEQWVTADPIPDWNVKPRDCSPRSVWQVGGPTRLTPPRCDKLLNLLAETQWPKFVTLSRQLLTGPFTLPRMQARVAQWRAELTPIVADDPILSASEWQAAVDIFPRTLRRAIDDFTAFLEQGLIAEPAAPADPTSEQLEADTQDTGLHIDGITNFEFVTPPAEPAPAGVAVYFDDLSTAAASWNTSLPLSGSADLRLDFTFTRRPGAWNEWIEMHLRSPQATDVTRYSRLALRVSADKSRSVRVRVASPAYSEEFGGALAEFGADIAVSSEPSVYTIRLDTLPYPQWAKDGWDDGQGWTSDAEARNAVLQRCNGLSFSPLATTDPEGELTQESETGYLQIDNIYFQ